MKERIVLTIERFSETQGSDAVHFSASRSFDADAMKESGLQGQVLENCVEDLKRSLDIYSQVI